MKPAVMARAARPWDRTAAGVWRFKDQVDQAETVPSGSRWAPGGGKEGGGGEWGRLHFEPKG